MLDRLGNEVDFAELFMEETLSAKDKKELPDSMYGLVYTDEKGNKVRKFPLNDESHVRQAAIFFDRAKGLSDDQKRELARNIVRRAKELDMDYSGWESLKPYLDKPIKESYDPDPDSTTGTSNFDDSHDDPDDCFCESFEEMFGYIIQETYKPYDEYLKLHQYDPKTNTIIINGKRVNAGIMGSNKQRNRMNKFLRENNYNPKDGTIETSIDENGKKKRVDFNITPGEDGKSENYQYVKNGQIVGKDFDISMSPKSISGKPGLSNQTKEHETGHGDIYLNREKYEKDFVDSSMHNLKKSQSGAYDNGHKPQVAHAKDPEENVADVYGTTHNRYGTSWHNTQMNKFMSQEKVVNNKLTNNIDNWKKKQDSILKRNEENTPTPSSDVDSEFKRLKKEQEDWEDEIKEAKAAGDPVYVSRKGKILLNASDEEIMNMAKDSINKAQEAHLKKLNEARQSVDEKYVKMKKDNRDHIRSYNNEMNSRKEFVQNKLNQNQNQQQSTDANDSPPPIKESFEEIFGSVIQEAFDAITGEEIPINHAYTMEEMAKRTFSEFELQHIKHNDEMEHVNKIFFDECYFASPTDYGKSMTLDGPLFVTPYKAIASIFCGRDKVKESIPKIGSYNLGYKEWTDVKVHGANNKPLNKPLKEVHVYIEGYPFLESKTIEAEGFIHCINAKTYNENFYKYPWMAKDDREYLIANTDGNKVEFTRTIKCKVRYIIEGKPARPGQDDLGPRPNGLTHWIHEIANKIHAKYKADQKKPTGNQNCLLCSWCAEAQMRGQDYLPRPIYSPRDPALEIVPGDIIGGVTKKNPGNFYDMLEQLRGDSIKQPFARWYCHVKWGHSNGGHEFLIVKVDEDSFVIMDAQQGTVKPLNADNSYMKNVDWEGTYICRIDDKPFKYMKLDKINDPKKTLPWDPKKDIPYMVKHGLCTKEEAEKELKKTETNLFTSELKKALDQTPIQESVDSLALFKQLPKDLQEYLKKGDFSDIDEEYGIDGYGVEIENISSPEYLDIAGHTYDLKEDDKFYNSIDFATDGGGNDFVYNPADGFYYSLDHEMWDEYDHIHGDKLSSRKWSELIDPNHNSKPDDYEFKTERDTKFRNICEDPTYAKLCNLTLTENVSNLLCSSIYTDFKHTSFENKVWAFANQYDYESIENAMTDLHLFIKNDFQPKLFVRNKYDIDGLKSRSVKFIESMLDEAKRSHINTALCNYQTTSIHKRFVEKYGLKPIQEGAWNDIRNGVNPWSKKRVFHITQQGHLDGQIFNPRVPEYLDKYDPSKDKFEDVDNPRVCFSPSIEGALNAIMVTIGRWKTADKLRDWYVYIPEKPIDQYKHKTTKELVKEKKVYDANVTNEVWIEEPVRLKQYGIIRVDQVSDKHIKKTVPTTTGFQGHRYRYDFKYHWVVKPKVIADVPYDYTPMGVCKDMVDEGYNFKYGLGANGSVQKASPEEYDKNYRLESPEEFEKNGGGICFDFVEWQAGYLEAYGYTCRKFFISTETDDNMTHTFILVDGGNGELIYPEISFELLQGVHEVKSPEEAIRMIIEKMIEYHKTESIKYYVWEYSGHPPYGSDIETCTKYFSKGEPFHEGTLNKPEKIK